MTVGYTTPTGYVPQVALLENWHRAEFVVSEARGFRSRDQGTLTGGIMVLAGTVCGKATNAGATPPTVAPAAGNTGNGVLTVDPTAPEQGGAQPGAYTVKFDGATSYVVFDPSGREVGVGKVGTAFNNQIKFNIAAGGTAYAVDDVITVTVAAGTGLYAPLNLTGVDGTEVAAAILWGTTDVTTGNHKAAFLTREAEVNAAELIWPTGISPTQQAAATAQLTALGIILR